MIAQHIAQHLRNLYFGGNPTLVNMKDTLDGLSWQQAVQQVDSFNTIATLVYHTSYYVTALIGVLRGEPLTAKDKYSFDHPPITSQEEWDSFVQQRLDDVEVFADLIEKLPDDKIWEPFIEPKYGNYYRNFNGVIEHTHYHLGQIVLIKKLVTSSAFPLAY